MKWKPKEGEEYWMFTSCLEVMSRVNPVKDCWPMEVAIFPKRFKAGNCFRTKKEAQAAAKKIKEILRG